MKGLILGGTGKVGRHVVATLRAAGHDAHAGARNDGDVRLDMRDASAVAAAARGYDAAFFITPLGADETEVGLAVLAALQDAGVSRVGYLAIHNLDAMRIIPHFETKIPIRDAVIEGGGFVVAPNFFFDNDTVIVEAIKAGVYALPVGQAGVWSVDSGDIGRIAALALASGDHDGTVVPVCGPEALTGASMAQSWSRALDRPVRYGGDAIAPFVGMMAAHVPGFGDWERDDFTRMFEVTQALGCPSTEADRAASRAALDRDLRRYDDFVHTLAERILQ